MKLVTLLLVCMTMVAALAAPLFAHCEIPCGIYNDKMRFDMIEEHITTIEKSMNSINELSQARDKNYNQLVRWVTNKEEHAVELQHIVEQYFLTQRIKPVEPDAGDDYATYQKHLELCHRIIVHAMKAKQTTDLAHVEALRAFTAEFRASYLGPEGEAHEH
jgi:nickel superoxide dismutase